MEFTFFTRSAAGKLIMAVALSAVSFMAQFQTAFAETKTLYVKMANTPIFSEPSMESAKIATAQGGDQLSALEEAGRFYKVRTAKGETGYVPRMNVTEGKPAPASTPQGETPLDELVGALGGERVARLEEASSSHAIRGKMSIVKRMVVISRTQAEESVSATEKFTVGAGDVKKFRKDGGLDAAD